MLLWSVVLQSHSSAKHGAIVIDFIPLLWRKAIVYGDKNLVNVGWTHYNAGQLIWWFCLTSRSGVSQRDFLEVKGDKSLTSNKLL